MAETTWFTEQHEHSGSSIGFRVTAQLHSEQTPFQKIDIYDSTDWGKIMSSGATGIGTWLAS